MLLPGEMRHQWDDDGKTFSAWEGGRTVWFSSLAFSGERSKTIAELRAKQKPGALETFELDEGDRVGLAELGKGTNEGREFWKLSGRTHVRGGLAITTVCFDRHEDLDWALGVWRSLRHGDAR